MGIYYRKTKKDGIKAYGRFMHEGRQVEGKPLADFNGDVEPRTPKIALIAFEALKAAVRSGEIFKVVPDGAKMTMETFVDHYLNAYWRKHEHTLSEEPTIRTIGRYFGTRPLAVIQNAAEVEAFKAWLVNSPKVKGTGPRSTVTINHTLGRLRHMIRYAIAHEWLTKNPFENDRLLRIDPLINRAAEVRRNRGVTQAELELLRANASPLMKDLLEIALATGARVSEILRLQMKDVDWTEWIWNIAATKVLDGKTVRNTKTGEDRVVPLSLGIRPIFTRRRNAFNKDAFLFALDGVPLKRGDYQYLWRKLLNKTQLDPITLQAKGSMTLHFHDLRGEAATQMLNAGYTADIVSSILGNTPQILTKHYKGSMLPAMRKAVER